MIGHVGFTPISPATHLPTNSNKQWQKVTHSSVHIKQHNVGVMTDKTMSTTPWQGWTQATKI
jgi:hypothetical protein